MRCMTSHTDWLRVKAEQQQLIFIFQNEDYFHMVLCLLEEEANSIVTIRINGLRQ